MLNKQSLDAKKFTEIWLNVREIARKTYLLPLEIVGLAENKSGLD